MAYSQRVEPSRSMSESERADAVFVNGKILTVDERSSVAEAVAVTHGQFSAVGSSSDIGQLSDRIVDLGGRVVVPGFIDAHAHMDREGLKFLLETLEGVRSMADVLERIAAAVRRAEPGEWIVTMPIGDYPEFGSALEILAERRYPTRWDLDSVAPENPVYIRGAWYYWNNESPIVSIANSLALRLAGVTDDTQPPHDRIEIGRSPGGRVDGIFREVGRIGSVEYTLMRVVPQFTHDDRVAALGESMRRYNAVGTTSVYEGHGVAAAVVGAYRELHERGEMTVRSHLVVSPTWRAWQSLTIESAMSRIAGVADAGPGDDMLSIDGVYVEVGSSVQDDARAAAGSNPGWAGYSVDSIFPSDRGTLIEVLVAAAEADIRVNAITHDAELLDRYLTALEVVNRHTQIVDRRWVLQHLSFVTADQLDRLAALGIATTIVPGTTIWRHGIARTSQLDDPAAGEYVPLRGFIDRGMSFALSTDNVPIEPLKGISSAVTRRDARTGVTVGPGQRLTREEALRAFTVAGAHLTFDEHKKRSIEVGKLADFVVLSDDVIEVPAEQICDIKVDMTVVGGTTVHDDR